MIKSVYAIRRIDILPMIMVTEKLKHLCLDYVDYKFNYSFFIRNMNSLIKLKSLRVIEFKKVKSAYFPELNSINFYIGQVPFSQGTNPIFLDEYKKIPMSISIDCFDKSPFKPIGSFTVHKININLKTLSNELVSLLVRKLPGCF